MHTKNRIKDLMSEYGFFPNKRLGQNFLVDSNIAKKIVNTLELSKKDVVLEIGPGCGMLTDYLVKTGRKVVAVEIDKKMSKMLRNRYRDIKNAEIVHQDILKFNIAEWIKKKNLDSRFRGNDNNVKKIKVVGNVPYYITTPIVMHLLKFRDSIESISITIQKEVSDRFTAVPDTKAYGAVTCYVQFYTDVRFIMDLPKDVFYPVPGVDSVLIRLEVLKKPAVKVNDEKLFFNIIRTSFKQRRKMLANTIGPIVGKYMDKTQIRVMLEKLGLNPNCRGEDLSLSEFGKIADAVFTRLL